MTDSSRWRAAADGTGDDLDELNAMMEKTSYYPGGDRGGIVPQEPQLEVQVVSDMNKGPAVQVAGVFLVMLGLFSVFIVYAANDATGVRALSLIAAFVLSGTGVHLLVNGIPHRAEKEESETTSNVALAAMGLGAVLGIVLLNNVSGVLQWYAGIMAFILFVYGYVSLLSPKK